LIKLLYVGLGGFCGAVLRFLAGNFVNRLFVQTSLQPGTMAVNITGCLFIGFLGGLADSRAVFNETIRLFLFVGLLGGFTTFSTFQFEVFHLFREGHLAAGLINMGGQVVIGFVAVWLGFTASRLI